MNPTFGQSHRFASRFDWRAARWIQPQNDLADLRWGKIVRARNAIQTGGYDDEALLDPVLAPLSVDLGDGNHN
ncbi:MAG: hypothetical protein GY778_15970 [bacterium]|nr:hypothetical protein [bacterium]